jgi:hypothetical protein
MTADWLPYALNVPLEILSIFGLAAFIVFGIPAIIRAIRN